MQETYPLYIYLTFSLTVLLALFLFYKATHQSKAVLIILGIWLAAQTRISLSGFYSITNTFPPRVALLLLPPVVMILVLFNTTKGKLFIDGLDIKTLTLFHIIRLPVELTLLWLFASKAIPKLMTFEGRNFDIFSGISAPIIYYFVFVKQTLGKNVLLAWNFICLLLVLNIAVNAILSAPGKLQQFGFDQPNIAILQFPFVFLPSLLVPLVVFSHLAAIRQIVYHRTYAGMEHGLNR